MLKKIFNALNLTRKKVSENIDKSTDFIDKALDQEYITEGIDKAKELTGKVAEAAGEAVESVRQVAKEALDTPEMSTIKDKLTEVGKDIKDKSQALADKALEHEIVRDTVAEIKDTAKEVKSSVEEVVDEVKSKLDLSSSEVE